MGKKLASTMTASFEPSPMPSHKISRGIRARGGVMRKQFQRHTQHTLAHGEKMQQHGQGQGQPHGQGKPREDPAQADARMQPQFPGAQGVQRGGQHIARGRREVGVQDMPTPQQPPGDEHHAGEQGDEGGRSRIGAPTAPQRRAKDSARLPGPGNRRAPLPRRENAQRNQYPASGITVSIRTPYSRHHHSQLQRINRIPILF